MNEQYEADVRNWLMRVADGVKTMRKQIKYGDCQKGEEWRVTASCYDVFSDGIAIHHVKQLAEVIGEEVNYVRAKDSPYSTFGYYYFDLFGVRFYDLAKEDV